MDTILIYDYGSQYTLLIAKKLRKFGVYTLINKQDNIDYILNDKNLNLLHKNFSYLNKLEVFFIVSDASHNFLCIKKIYWIIPNYVTLNCKKISKWELFPGWFGHVLDYFCSFDITTCSSKKNLYTKDWNAKK